MKLVEIKQIYIENIDKKIIAKVFKSKNLKNDTEKEHFLAKQLLADFGYQENQIEIETAFIFGETTMSIKFYSITLKKQREA